MKNTAQNLRHSYKMMNLDVPLRVMTCDFCRMTAKPDFQIRLAPDECGEPTDVICWDCSKCKMHNITPDDLSILSTPIIFDKGEIR